MVRDFYLPQLGDSVQEGLVTNWYKKAGDAVEVNEPLLEITTDKVSIEIPSDFAGTITEILTEVGQKVKANALLCKIDGQ